MRLSIYIVLLLALSGCGYFNSGTWEDDPKNWERLFGEAQPEEVTVVHSYFWKSAHWTYESMAYFEIKTDEEFIKSFFIDYYELTEMEERQIKYLPFDLDMPEWFTPKDLSNYRIWEDHEYSFYLYRDKETNQVYFSIDQL